MDLFKQSLLKRKTNNVDNRRKTTVKTTCIQNEVGYCLH